MALIDEVMSRARRALAAGQRAACAARPAHRDLAAQRDALRAACGRVARADSTSTPATAAAVRVQTTFALLHQSHPAVAALYRQRRLWDDMAAEEVSADLRADLAAALERQRDAALQQLAGGGGIIGAFFRALLTSAHCCGSRSSSRSSRRCCNPA
jgi:hypothetical protein